MRAETLLNLGHCSIASASSQAWHIVGTSLVVQWLRLHAPNTGGMGSIPGQGTKIPCAATKTWCKLIH